MKILRWTSVILVFAFLAVLTIHHLGSINQDIGRHLKSGQIIWESKNIYRTNFFSFTEPDRPFIDHHWLSEVIFFLLNGWIGLKGLIIFKTIIILGTFALLFSSIYKKTGIGPLLVSMLIGIFVFAERTDVRPEIFSYLFLAFFLFAIFQAKYARTKHARATDTINPPLSTSNVDRGGWLYGLPLVQVLWTNMHIYFVLGPLLLLIFLIDRLAHRSYSHRFLLIFLATSIATLINPSFIHGALLPFHILNDYGYTIVENQSTTFLKDYGVLLRQISIFEFSLVALGLSFIIALRRGRKKIVFELLVSVAFSALALKMIRNFAIYALLLIPILALNLKAIWTKRPWPTRKVATGYVLLLASLIFLISTVPTNAFYQWLGSSKKFGLEIPVGAAKGVEFVKETQLSGPVFNNFDVGSFLIWKLYPKQKVFIDGRPEAYSTDFLENIYKGMQQNPALWKKYSEQYSINYIFFDHHDITPWARTFLKNISTNPNWPIVYLDDSVVILVKKAPANQELINRFEKRDDLIIH